MRDNYTLARLHHDGPLTGEITLGPKSAHYLGRVIRKGEGDRVRLFNGRDGEVAAEIVSVAKKSLSLRVTERLRVPYAPPPVTLMFAPLKRHRTATLLEKATELGVTTLQPVITARTQHPKMNLARMQSQIVEAAEQTERLDLPDIHEPVALLDAVSHAREPILMGDEAGHAPTLLDALGSMRPPLALLVGPEGGWSPDERESLHALDHLQPVTLGPRILRADTAAISMLTLVQAAVGDWRAS